MAARESMLLCHVRARLCALPVRYVVETLRPLPIEPLQGVPAFVLGVALIRGMPVPVVDPGVMLGGGERPLPLRFVVLRLGARQVAFAVEGVIGVRQLASTSLAELPPLLRDAGAELVSVLGSLDSELLLVLRAARVIEDAIWSALGEGAA